MTGGLKILVQRAFNRAGYHLRRLDVDVDLVDPYAEQVRLVGNGVTTIFEIGAADGRDCVRYRRLFPDATVYAFEPLPENYSMLAAKAAADAMIRPVQAAAASEVGTARFHVAAWHDASSLLQPVDTGATFDTYQASTLAIDVATIALDTFAADNGIERIDILKMDAQGAELAILHGAAHLLAEGRIGLIYTEVQFNPSYQGAGRFNEIMTLLRDHGFELHNLYDLHHNQRGELCWGDAIFVPRGERLRG